MLYGETCITHNNGVCVCLTFFGGGDHVVRVDLRKTTIITRRRRLIGRHERYGRGRGARVVTEAFGRAVRSFPTGIADGRGRRRRHDQYDYHPCARTTEIPTQTDVRSTFVGPAAHDTQ